MFNKSLNFIGRFDREKLYFKLQFINLVADSRDGSSEKKFQLKISKIMLARPKKTWS